MAASGAAGSGYAIITTDAVRTAATMSIVTTSGRNAQDVCFYLAKYLCKARGRTIGYASWHVFMMGKCAYCRMVGGIVIAKEELVAIVHEVIPILFPN